MATRGTIYLITDKYIMSTLEFNGDMYKDGYGGEIMEELEYVKSLKDFRKTITNFNNRNHQYNEDLFYPVQKKAFLTKKGTEYIIEMTDDNYFTKFFSDWTFWKNISNEKIIISTRNEYHKNIELKPKEQIAINFGRYDGHYKAL